ncbi:MAG: dephospho-CoA kinase [Deinococcus sp.]|nr:dephospho-CoA kinase [Deinococcus sp.]
MQVVGLTGGLGSGKSTVAALLRSSGLPVIDADLVARQVTQDPAVLERIAQAFGPQVRRADGSLDRQAVASIVFQDQQARQQLNQIVHPLVRQALWAEVARLRGSPAPPPAVVLDIPLLIEGGWHTQMDLVVVVWATPEQQLERAIARGGLTRAQAQQRLAAQMSLKDKLPHAHVVIDNSGTLESTRFQVQALLARLTETH